MLSSCRASGLPARFLVIGCGLLLWGAAPVIAQDGLVVRQLTFSGNRSIDRLTIAAAIATTNSSAFATIPLLREIGLGAKRHFDQRVFERDVERVRLLYRIHGFLEVQVDTLVRRTAEDIYITFVIEEGAPVILRRLTISGLDSLSDRADLMRDLPLQVGDAFNRFLLGATADTLRDRLRNRGYPRAAVFLADRSVDSASRSASVDLRVVTGNYMVVGSIIVEGAADEADSLFVRSFLATQPGREYRQSDLFDSQRNLALADLYRFASVEIDSARFDESEDTVPLVVRVVAGPQQRITASSGFGTDDCFRGSLGWTGRNTLGRGRILDASVRFSKLGVGRPTDFGFERNLLCGRLKQDSIGSERMNYNAAISVRRPGFFGARTSASIGLFAELASEFAVYAREALGVNVLVSTETKSRIPLTLGYRLAFGTTDASDASFCAYFNACTPDDIGVLRSRQRQGLLSFGLSSLNVNNLLDPRRGRSIGLRGSYSGAITGSDSLQRFTRVAGDAALYHALSRDVVLVGRIRAGVLFAPKSFQPGGGEAVSYVPPDQRFYAGGPNDVRGYDGNQLGPVVYVVLDSTLSRDSIDAVPSVVTVSPIGGNRLLVGNLELRLPSPVLRTLTRLAIFVDAGTVWETGFDRSSSIGIRVTPGAGIRFVTPLGPARIDVAYNPYSFPPGDLFQSRSDGSLGLLERNYIKPGGSGFTVHFAVGQAF